MEACPYLPHCETGRRKAHGEGRGVGFYLDALAFAQGFWLEGKPAQAILQLNRAFSADLGEDDPVLKMWPWPYAALEWILENAADGGAGFLGNPVRHFQHLATRMSGPRREERIERAWKCFHIARRVLAGKGEFPLDGRQIAREGIFIPLADGGLADKGFPMNGVRRVTLRDGTPGIVRAIIPADGVALAAALQDLAPESRMRRFFYDKTSLSESELERLANPDGVNHIAYGLAVDLEGEFTPIAVGRCFRDPKDGTLAEIAVVTADAWQGKGAGAELMRSLSTAAWNVGIRKWLAPMFCDNTAMRRLLDAFADKQEERDLGGGVVEAIYRIKLFPKT